jgi:uncharacterized protein (TIGR03435 family)
LSRASRAGLGAAALAVLGAPVVIGAVTAPRVIAQPAAAAEPAFEYALIAEGQETDGQEFVLRGSGIEVRNQPLRRLIAFAYDVQQAQVDGPDEIDSRRYTITAGMQVVFPLESRQLLRTLLEERFALAAHRERQRITALVLGRAADGAGRLPIAAAATAQRGIRIQPGSLELMNAPLSLLAEWLSQVFETPVLDETGLADGAYSFTLKWEDNNPPGQPPNQAELLRALESQAGLSLLEAARDVERLVVDSVAEPTGLWTPPQAAPQDAAVLDRYVGYYALFGSDRIMSVERDADHLLLKVIAEEPLNLYRRDDKTFAAMADSSVVTFDIDEQAAVRSLHLERFGTKTFVPRVDTTVAMARLATLQRRIDAQAPTPGGEAIVRGIAHDLAGEGGTLTGPPRDWARMLRGALTTQMPDRFAQRGELQSVAFKSIAPNGHDVYEVAFENLRVDVFVGLDDDGSLMGVNYRPIAE